MKSIHDYANPFESITDFEAAIAEFTGAPYCVTTDCCSHAIEIAFRLTEHDDTIVFPSHTYISVPMTFEKLGINYEMTDENWWPQREYQFRGSMIWDCARRFEPNMYRLGAVQCISFGRTKQLELGRGGCMLTDSYELYEAASRMRSDGRALLDHKHWVDQGIFNEGFHYWMRPEDCVRGLNTLLARQFTEQRDEFYNYPDCNKITIIPSTKIQL